MDPCLMKLLVTGAVKKLIMLMSEFDKTLTHVHEMLLTYLKLLKMAC